MFNALFLAAALVAGDFEEYVEHEEYVEAFEESPSVIIDEEEVILAFEEVDEIEEVVPIHWDGISEELAALIQECVQSGVTVVDFGETKSTTKMLSRLVGPLGKVLSFDMEGAIASQMSSNIEPHCVDLEEVDVELDTLEVENLAFIKVDAWGNEDAVIEGAKKTIAKQKPFILVNMLGGIPVENTDRYVKEVFQQRMDQIRQMGYVVQRINETFYLAKKKETSEKKFR